MTSIQCEHIRATSTGRMCLHLLDQLTDKDTDREYVVWFDGTSEDYALICGQCREIPPDERKARVITVCRDCFEWTESDGFCEGVIGQPLVPLGVMNMKFAHEIIRLKGNWPISFADVQPLNTQPGHVWLGVAEQGTLVKLDFDQAAISTITTLPEDVYTEMTEVEEITVCDRDPDTGKPRERQEQRTVHLDVDLRIHMSTDGLLAAVVNNRGRYGVVLSIEDGRFLQRLDRGRTYYHATNFPCVFTNLDGRSLLVHGTAWNRVDITDPLTGDLLTNRETPVRQRGAQIPEHYSQYFHAGLWVSPDYEWLVGWGWFWHPIGSITAWSLRRWIKENVWESEDGPSLKRFCNRDYHWDGSLCWIDKQTIAVWGRGVDDMCLFPAVCSFDVTSGDEVRWFMGPPQGQLVYDDFLFSFGSGKGTSVWDIETGECLLIDPELRPVGYHHIAKCFLSILSDGSFRLSRLENE